MKKTIFTLFIVLFISLSAHAGNGMVHVKSQFDVKTTADRLEKILNNKGMTIFNRIKHSQSALKVGVQLRDTEVIIFGNPKAGTPLMKCQQSIAIDLPQKALIWKDKNNEVWVSYNDLEYLKSRHNVEGCDALMLKISNLLGNLTQAATHQ